MKDFKYYLSFLDQVLKTGKTDIIDNESNFKDKFELDRTDIINLFKGISDNYYNQDIIEKLSTEDIYKQYLRIKNDKIR